MIEVSTGTLDFEQYDEEIAAIVDLLAAFGQHTVYVSLSGEQKRDRQWQDVQLQTDELIDFLAELEEFGILELRNAPTCDAVTIESGGVSFLFCDLGDIHCWGKGGPLLAAVRERWRREYPHSYDRHCGGRWHRLKSRPRRGYRG